MEEETEIEVYDTRAATDSVTGKKPVKALIRKRTTAKGTIRAEESAEATRTAAAEAKTEAETQSVQDSREESKPGQYYWKAVMWGLVVLAASGILIYQLKKR